MKKIAILGCENSHANTFLDNIIRDKKYPHIEVLGVFRDDNEAAKEVGNTYEVPIMSSYDQYAGMLDGVIITARHGDNHYKYAKPYIADEILMFVDKPITISEDDALKFMNELREKNIRVCGGSVCVLSELVSEMKSIVKNKSEGEIYGGYLRAPVIFENPYGNFFFYSQHLVEVMCEIFGYYPQSLKAYRNGRTVNCTVRYANYDVNLLFTEGSGVYSANVSCEKKLCGGEYLLDGLFEKEFETFNQLLLGNEQKKSYQAMSLS